MCGEIVCCPSIQSLTFWNLWVEEMVRSGDITPEEARHHPWRNRITRGLGMNPNVTVAINIYDWQPGDTLVLCSDGLTRHVNDDEIAALVMNYLPREAVAHLIE
ncbi:MAG: serine/threonine-protein phosphatase, partial [SAR324 cluster bacterium]